MMRRTTRHPLAAACVFLTLAMAVPPEVALGRDTQGGRQFDLLSATIADVQTAVAAGALTYERLVERYLARIEAYDRNGPELRAVIEINPRASWTTSAAAAGCARRCTAYRSQ